MKPTELLFHVPGAEFILDEKGRYKYDCNYLTMGELRAMDRPPEQVGVLDRKCGKKLGMIDTKMAFKKFT